ncbi:hypothetical protein L484_022920 [Morus notabilis]|uniref:Uncharacterized protein n=1 Tax=Morus notabilis TaxID=981085 RepID=W9QTE4_9ROSA|nr:hypothetical protein L484_022920 [Morus notabilis]
MQTAARTGQKTPKSVPGQGLVRACACLAAGHALQCQAGCAGAPPVARPRPSFDQSRETYCLFKSIFWEVSHQTLHLKEQGKTISRFVRIAGVLRWSDMKVNSTGLLFSASSAKEMWVPTDIDRYGRHVGVGLALDFYS